MTFRPASFDPTIDPTADQVRALRDAGPDGPVVMLNLLKFREQANHPAASAHVPCSGAEAYRSCQTACVDTVGNVSRAEVVWEGRIDRPFIGEASPAANSLTSVPASRLSVRAGECLGRPATATRRQDRVAFYLANGVGAPE